MSSKCRISWSLLKDCSFSNWFSKMLIFLSMPVISGVTIGNLSMLTAADILHGFFSHFTVFSDDNVEADVEPNRPRMTRNDSLLERVLKNELQCNLDVNCLTLWN